MRDPNQEDPRVRERWLAEQRHKVERYLEREEIRHRGVARQADWFVLPYVSLWRVESAKTPGAIGWWVISGDLPTDYLSGHSASDARTAIAAFAKTWRELSESMLRGEERQDVKITSAENNKEIADLLRRRALILQQWADDEHIWE